MRFSLSEITCDFDLIESIYEFPLTVKISIFEDALVRRTIFETICTLSVRLVVLDISLVEISVFKYNLTFCHQS